MGPVASSCFSTLFDVAKCKTAGPRAAPRQDNITGRSYLLRGRPVLVLARWAGAGPRNVLVQDQDGARQVRPFRGLRRLPGGCHAG